MIRVQMIGNLGANAECKNVNGVNYTTFRIAHNSKWADSNGVMHEETLWVNCIGRYLEAVRPYLVAGKKVWIEGTPSVRVYQSSKDKQYYASMDINVNLLELISSKDSVPGNTAPSAPTPQNATVNPSEKPAGDFNNSDSDMPF